MTQLGDNANSENVGFGDLNEIKQLLVQLQNQEQRAAVMDEKLDKINALMAQLEKELTNIAAESKLPGADDSAAE